MKDHKRVEGRILQINKKWHQLKQKQQIIISTMLRDLYIKFVLENNRKPNKVEKQFIVANVYLELQEKEIWIADNEISNYFESRISKYDKSIEKSGLLD
jgi:hypothetical protein